MTETSTFTIGHSTHAIETFVELLKQHRIGAIADVRSVPFSRWQPQFNRDSLTEALKQNDIDYVFLGKELGARSDDPSCYEGGRVSYRCLADTASFRSGIERVQKGSRRYRIALMCAEKEPLECHRTVLVARELIAAGTEVAHILADGSLEEHGETMQRLLAMHGLPEEDLFRSSSEFLDQAYALQEERIAYVLGTTGKEQ